MDMEIASSSGSTGPSGFKCSSVNDLGCSWVDELPSLSIRGLASSSLVSGLMGMDGIGRCLR